ncbi:hypothetical protein B0H13DRAFT_1862079 [Mycena leptocephala]|nr:hypothetical protein B0H13DRAFT_1862079 [Mycena leptocephala]
MVQIIPPQQTTSEDNRITDTSRTPVRECQSPNNGGRMNGVDGRGSAVVGQPLIDDRAARKSETKESGVGGKSCECKPRGNEILGGSDRSNWNWISQNIIQPPKELTRQLEATRTKIRLEEDARGETGPWGVPDVDADARALLDFLVVAEDTFELNETNRDGPGELVDDGGFAPDKDTEGDVDGEADAERYLKISINCEGVKRASADIRSRVHPKANSMLLAGRNTASQGRSEKLNRPTVYSDGEQGRVREAGPYMGGDKVGREDSFMREGRDDHMRSVYTVCEDRHGEDGKEQAVVKEEEKFDV